MFFSNWFAKRKIAILLFHSVVAGTPPKGTRRFGPETSISSDEFEQIIRKASEKYNILSMDDVWQGKTSDKPGIVLTFDDGFQDNIDIALPILKKFNAPAMIYVTSGFIDRSVNPFEYLLSDVIEKNTEIAINLETKTEIFNTQNSKDKEKAYIHVKNILKHFPHRDRRNALQYIIEKDYSDSLSKQFLSMSALVELSNSPLVSIGCHTHYHQALSSIPETDAQHDLSMGKRNLEKWTGNQIDHFSYPYGKVNHRIAKMVQSTGFKTAVTTKPGVERIGFNDPFNISRFEIKKLDDFLSTTRILER